jgi:hypothetical protein
MNEAMKKSTMEINRTHSMNPIDALNFPFINYLIFVAPREAPTEAYQTFD